MSVYAAVAQRSLATIKRKGGKVVFPGAIVGTPPTYDPTTDTYSGGTPPTDAVGHAVKDQSDPDRYRALSLVLVNPVTLVVAGEGLPITIVPGMPMVWAGRAYTVRNVDDINPAGDKVIAWLVIGDV